MKDQQSNFYDLTHSRVEKNQKIFINQHKIRHLNTINSPFQFTILNRSFDSLGTTNN